LERKARAEEYENLKRQPSVKRWLDNFGESESTRHNALYSLARFCEYSQKNPEQLIDDRIRESKSEDLRERHQTEDLVKAFSKNIKGGHTFASFVKSFFMANYLPLLVKIGKARSKREPSGYPDDSKLQALINTTSSKDVRAIEQFLIESGARIGSVLKLRYKNIKEDLESGKLPCKIVFPSAITKGSISYVGFIGEDAVNVLKDYLKWRSTDRERKDRHGKIVVLKARPITDESYLFESRNDKPLSRNSMIERIQNFAYQAGLNQTRTGLKQFHPHILRARAQTLIESCNVPLNWVDLMLGHIPRGAQGQAYSRPSVEDLRTEYAKAYPKLRVFKTGIAAEDIEKVADLRYYKLWIEDSPLKDVSPEVLITEQEKKLGRPITVMEKVALLRAKYEELRTEQNELMDAGTESIAPVSNGSKKIVTEDELQDYLNQGWDVSTALPSGKIVIYRK